MFQTSPHSAVLPFGIIEDIGKAATVVEKDPQGKMKDAIKSPDGAETS
jgi:hypothetical protein